MLQVVEGFQLLDHSAKWSLHHTMKSQELKNRRRRKKKTNFTLSPFSCSLLTIEREREVLDIITA